MCHKRIFSEVSFSLIALFLPLLALVVDPSFTLFSAKNVAADISEKLCDSVATKLEGKVLGTFSGKIMVVIINMDVRNCCNLL